MFANIGGEWSAIIAFLGTYGRIRQKFLIFTRGLRIKPADAIFRENNTIGKFNRLQYCWRFFYIVCRMFAKINALLFEKICKYQK